MTTLKNSYLTVPPERGADFSLRGASATPGLFGIDLLIYMQVPVSMRDSIADEAGNFTCEPSAYSK